jgi:hypothetical protein
LYCLSRGRRRTDGGREGEGWWEGDGIGVTRMEVVEGALEEDTEEHE